MPKVTTWQLSAGSALIGLVLAAGLIVASGPWDSGQRTAERDWAAARAGTGGTDHGQPPRATGPAPAPSAPAVLAALGSDATPTGKGLARALGPLMDDPALGTDHTGVVIDAATGKRLYAVKAERPMTPASTVKLATMVAGLSALGPDHRIATTVLASPDGKQLTLRGGGDPTLDRARLDALADDTVRVLHDRGVTSVRIGYDTSLYSGPVQHPIGPNDNIAPVTALMMNEGRLDRSAHGPAPRSGDPAGDVARAFALLLAHRSVSTAHAPAPGRPPAHAKPVARTYSAPLSGLVERALTNSDNDIAEAIARQTALATGRPASFDGAGRAVKAQLSKLGLPLDAARFADGSGLDRQDKVSASLLGMLLLRAGDPHHRELRPVLTGLPVAGFSGTLEQRYTGGSGATGLLRAKTGTLTGVNTLAGTVVDARGRLLVLAFMASGTTSPGAAESALDRLGTAVASCGCSG
ncbi:D-alanyl-D-alanine carboxypeptidase/D-alanyl-D-alanine-endopeptidase [Streptomyces sp. NPDC051320]|uniref:D-alanyl-D-alanine carboxypeptidase/D-alanyl-D-alanine endopeptidase n=1 Tax=Streptomyces sp. NPDC051320 TaxID=3154644 RepID=UPI003419CF54